MSQKIKLLFLLATITAASCPFTFAARRSGPDQKDFENKTLWKDCGDVYNLPLIDNKGNMYVRQTKFYVANSDLVRSHTADGKGHTLPHVHFMHDYQSLEIEDANRYWDKKSDCPQLAERISSATDKQNNYTSMLNELGQATYRFWIDDLDVVDKAFETESGSGPANKNELAPLTVPERMHWKNGVGGTYMALPRSFSAKDLQTMTLNPR